MADAVAYTIDAARERGGRPLTPRPCVGDVTRFATDEPSYRRGYEQRAGRMVASHGDMRSVQLYAGGGQLEARQNR